MRSAAHPPASAARRALAVLREEGLASFWFRLASVLGYRRLLLFERSLLTTVPQFVPKIPLRIDILTAGEVDDLLAFRPELGRERVLKRLQSAQACCVARHEGRIVSACWTATRSAWSEFLACEIALSAGEVYLFDSFTLPAYRRRGAASALCGHQLAYLREAGLRRAIRAALPENISALRTHAKTGFLPFALLTRLGLGPWHYTFQRPYRGGPAARA